MDCYNSYVNINNNEEEVNKVFADRGCAVLRYINDDLPIEYRCICGKIRVQRLEQFKKQRCRHCSYIAESSCPAIDDVIELSGEVWRRICGGWISSWGNAKNIHGKCLTLCHTKIRYRINGRHEYASRLVASAFQILGWEQLSNQKYVEKVFGEVSQFCKPSAYLLKIFTFVMNVNGINLLLVGV